MKDTITQIVGYIPQYVWHIYINQITCEKNSEALLTRNKSVFINK